MAHSLYMHVEQKISSPYQWASKFRCRTRERTLNFGHWATKLPLTQYQFSYSGRMCSIYSYSSPHIGHLNPCQGPFCTSLHMLGRHLCNLSNRNFELTAILGSPTLLSNPYQTLLNCQVNHESCLSKGPMALCMLF